MAAHGALRRIQAGNALSAFGSGFTVPFLFVFVTQVRHLGAGVAGLMFSVFALSALVVLPLTGVAIDRVGPRPVIAAGAVVAAAGSLTLGLSPDATSIMCGAVLLGGGVAALYPALSTAVVRCTDAHDRARAFSTQFMFNNLGLGIGGLIGGLVVDTSRPGSFTVLFVVEATMMLVLAAVTATVRIPAAEPVPAADRGSAAGLRHILRNRAMVRLLVVTGVIFFTCYGQFESGLAAFATEVAQISPSTLGFALAANTAAIVAASAGVLRMVERRRRSTVIAATGVVWLAAWAVAALSGLLSGHHAFAATAIIGTYMLFGVGETLLAPTLGPMVADLAPGHMLGQYNAAQSLVKQVALAVGPAFAGGMVAAGAFGPYLAVLIAFTVLIVVLGSRLRTSLTPSQDAVVKPAPVSRSSEVTAAA